MDNLTISPWGQTLRHTQATKVFISRTLMDCCPFSEEKEWPKVCSKRRKKLREKERLPWAPSKKAVLGVLETENFIHFYCVVMGAYIANWVWVLREWQGKKVKLTRPDRKITLPAPFSFFRPGLQNMLFYASCLIRASVFECRRVNEKLVGWKMSTRIIKWTLCFCDDIPRSIFPLSLARARYALSLSLVIRHLSHDMKSIYLSK